MIPTVRLRFANKSGAKMLQQWWVQPAMLNYHPDDVERIAKGAGEWRNVPMVEISE